MFTFGAKCGNRPVEIHATGVTQEAIVESYDSQTWNMKTPVMIAIVAVVWTMLVLAVGYYFVHHAP